jgi:hypothetical protein
VRPRRPDGAWTDATSLPVPRRPKLSSASNSPRIASDGPRSGSAGTPLLRCPAPRPNVAGASLLRSSQAYGKHDTPGPPTPHRPTQTERSRSIPAPVFPAAPDLETPKKGKPGQECSGYARRGMPSGSVVAQARVQEEEGEPEQGCSGYVGSGRTGAGMLRLRWVWGNRSRDAPATLGLGEPEQGCSGYARRGIASERPTERILDPTAFAGGPTACYSRVS